MSPYETQSLAIANEAVVIQAAAVLIAVAALVAAIVAGRTIWLQLRASQWNALLQFEMDMNHRWRDFTDLAGELQAKATSMNDQERQLFALRKKTLQESYLNSVDRLASSILHGQFPEEKLKADYRGFIEDALRDFPDAFGPGTRLRNTARLHEKWLK